MRPLRLILVSLALLAAAAPAASADDRMLVGFQDDPSFRWLDTRTVNLTDASHANASIVRSTVYWSRIAPKRPANAANPFDPAYRFDDLDEFVRNATYNGMTVMLTVWGTPSWANGGKRENRMPTRLSDFQNFTRALASRYSGRNAGYPFVGYYSIWNEPNLEQFLAPTYNASGKAVSPGLYAQLVRAGYAGLKAGNSRAKVAIGETSPRGRLKPTPAHGRIQDTIAPGLFAQLLSQVKPRIKFDAWAHHPYSVLGTGPLQKVRFPNVNLPQIPQFQKSLDKWFKRKGTPIWITEYGFEPKPGEPKGVTNAQQAAYAKQSLALAKKYAHTEMFIWFIFRDQPVTPWQSGLEREDASRKPAFSSFSAAAKQLDVRDPVVTMLHGKSNPLVRLPVWELYSRDGAGAEVGSTISVTYKGKSIAVVQPTAKITIDGYVSFRVPIKKAVAASLYRVFFTIADADGNQIKRTASIVVR